MARHADPDHVLPDECALAPFLPPPWRVGQVGGDVSIDRSLFGIHLYDIPLAGDGVVPLSSAHGYSVSAPDDPPWPARVDSRRVTCRVGFDTVYSAASAAVVGIGGGALGAAPRKPNIAWVALQSAATLLNDFQTFDDLDDEEMGLGLVAFLGYATVTAPCGHLNLTHDPASLDTMVDLTAGTLDALAQTPAARRPTISLAGYGGFRWGDTVEDAQAALGQEFLVSSSMAEDCQDAELPGWRMPAFGIRDGRVTNADAHDDSVVTDTGISVGDSLSEVLAAYPGITGSPVPAWPGSSEYRHTRDGRTAVFGTYDGVTVDYLRFGLAGTFGESTPCV